MTNELMQKAKACKSADELLALAKETGYEMSAEEAAAKYAELHDEGELSDDELDTAAGGGCGKKDVYYPEAGDHVSVSSRDKCPKCGSKTAIFQSWQSLSIGTCRYTLTCDQPDCGHTWKIDALIEETVVYPL